jgi:hypothetical protein
MTWILNRREFLQTTGLVMLPHHRPWHKPKPSPVPSPSPSPSPGPQPGLVFTLGVNALRDGSMLRAA